MGSEGVALGASAGMSGFFSAGLVSAVAAAGDGDSAGDGELTGDGSAVAFAGLLVSFCVSAFSVAGLTRRPRSDVGVGAAAGFACEDVFRFGVVVCATAKVKVRVDTTARAISFLRILIDKNFR